MKSAADQLRSLITDALPGMRLEVKDYFASNRVLVHASYERHAIVELDMDLLSGSEANLLDTLTVAAQQACDILRDDVRRDATGLRDAVKENRQGGPKDDRERRVEVTGGACRDIEFSRPGVKP